MQNGTQFNASLRDWAKRFAGSVDALARQTCQQLASDVKDDTPVDTGTLKAAWQPALNTPQVSGEGENGSAPVEISAVISGMRAGDKFWMTNNIKYGPYVEFGTSKMAGRFFVTRNVKRFNDVVKTVSRDLGL